MMNLYDMQQNPLLNPFQQNPFLAGQNHGQGYQGYAPWAGHGLAAYGQPFGQQPFGAQGIGWGQQRQLSQQDVGDVVRQLVPLLPQILMQAQHAPAAFGYGGQNQNQFGQFGRQLTQQDVNEVVRQILPMVPQIVGTLQGQGPLQAAAIFGGHAGQTGWPQYLAAFGGGQSPWGMQRQLSQQDVSEVVRQLIGIIPQAIGNLQAFNQQRAI